METGETLEEAALRELREEVAVEARVLGFNRHVEVIERDGDGRVERHFVVASFVGAWLAGEGTRGPEASEVLWASCDEVESLPTTDHLPGLLEVARRIAVMSS